MSFKAGETDVSGVIERVATGAKEAFRGVEAIGAVIMAMLDCASSVPPASSLTTPSEEKHSLDKRAKKDVHPKLRSRADPASRVGAGSTVSNDLSKPALPTT